MLELTAKSKCCGCHSCANSCPKNCIKMEIDDEGFLYPVIDKKLCINCGMCEKVCPVMNKPKIEKTKDSIFVYGAYTKNEDIRENSSSGGIFTEIATYVIAQGGVVFGATFDENLHVSHTYIEDVTQIKKMQGSKYLQSTIGESFKQAEKFLRTGRLVLFTGTPCQINGLYSYLGKNYDNLITQDIICHGVPSSKVWDEYIKYMEESRNKKVKEIYFRNKDHGWKDFDMKIVFDTKDTYSKRHSEDVFMKAFLKNLCLRPSCYACSFKDLVRGSDITLADFWGVKNVMPEISDDKGVSLVFINSEKGKWIFKEIKENIEHKKVENVELAIKYNPAMISSCNIHPNRKVFLNNVSRGNLELLVNKKLKISYIKRLVYKLKRIIRMS